MVRIHTSGTGIVTRGDLQKAQVRMLLFGLVTLLEMQFLRLILFYYPNDSWGKYLSKSRLESAKKLQEERQKRDEALNLADCLQFCDKTDLIFKLSELRERLGLETKKAAHSLCSRIEGLRNKLAHAQDIVTGTTWPELIELEEQIEELVRRCERIG